MEQKCNKQIDKSSKNPGNNGDMEIRVSYSMLGGCFSLFFFFFFLRSYRVSLVVQSEKNLPATQET